MAVSSLVSNQVDYNNGGGENQIITADHAPLDQSKSTSVAQQSALSAPAIQMRDELATKAALKEIDHKKI